MYYRCDLKGKAQSLRRNMTKEERHLWYDFLRHSSLQFYRQRPIKNYVVDFYCPKARLAIELDGGQHYEDDNMKYDAYRTRELPALGIEVLRFTNHDINEHFDSVCEVIRQAIEKYI